MKKITLLIALISFGTITAQTEKGTFAISGKTGLGFNSSTVKYEYQGQSTDGPKISSFNISPSVSYFIIDNLAIGLEFDYTTATTKQQILVANDYSTGFGYSAIDTKSTETTFSVIPTATYFFSKEKFRPYITAGMGYAKIKQKMNSSGTTSNPDAFYSYSDSDNNGLVLGAGGGLAYFISKAICFDLGLGYANFTYEEKDVKVKSGALTANVGISVFIK
ncbi:MAG TPA: outer membrane beta-barrel protein [Flavobacterium sp.]|nr:outer membrane beta-barrel protein [Flavobacterium sp.]